MKSTLEEGFGGYKSFASLRAAAFVGVPRGGGVYIIVRRATDDPVFLTESCGGHFKGRNPAVACELLAAKWVPDTPIVYIGKATSLFTRLRQYADFGAGKPIGHWGGRYIWQLADRDELLVAWKECEPGLTPEKAEADLVGEFKRAFGGLLPFANISDPSSPGGTL